MPLTVDAVAAVDPVHAATMREHPTSFEETKLPFYRRFALVRATIALPHRPLVVEYAYDGERVILLGGSASDIDAVNRAEDLSLAIDEVVPYLRFYLPRVSGQRVVERTAELTWLATSDEASSRARAAAELAIAPVSFDTVPEGFTVHAFVVEVNTLKKLTLTLGLDGSVSGDGGQTVVSDLPLPAVM